MSISLILIIAVTLVRLGIFALIIYAVVQGVKALRKYNRSGEVRREKAETRRSLGAGCPIGRQPAGRQQMGAGDCRSQYLQLAGAGEALRRICRGTAAIRGKSALNAEKC